MGSDATATLCCAAPSPGRRSPPPPGCSRPRSRSPGSRSGRRRPTSPRRSTAPACFTARASRSSTPTGTAATTRPPTRSCSRRSARCSASASSACSPRSPRPCSSSASPGATSATGARWGALWFGAGTAADLLIGRLTFAVGVTFALAAVFALQRGHRRSGVALAVGCTLGSPVAGLFLAMAGAAYWLSTRARIGLVRRRRRAGSRRRRSRCCSPRAAASPTRSARSCRSSLSCGAAAVAAAALRAPAADRRRAVPRRRAAGVRDRRRRWAATSAASASRSPGRCCSARCCRAAAARAAAASCSPRSLPLLVWQWWAPVRETIKGAVDPSGQAAYFAPLLRFIDGRAEAARAGRGPVHAAALGVGLRRARRAARARLGDAARREVQPALSHVGGARR